MVADGLRCHPPVASCAHHQPRAKQNRAALFRRRDREEAIHIRRLEGVSSVGARAWQRRAARLWLKASLGLAANHGDKQFETPHVLLLCPAFRPFLTCSDTFISHFSRDEISQDFGKKGGRTMPGRPLLPPFPQMPPTQPPQKVNLKAESRSPPASRRGRGSGQPPMSTDSGVAAGGAGNFKRLQSPEGASPSWVEWLVEVPRASD